MAATAIAGPLTIQPVPYFAAAVLAQLRPAVEAHKLRRAFCAPEVIEYPDDICYECIDTLFQAADSMVSDLIQCGTAEDMQALLAYFTDIKQSWPAHRRAFFTYLYQYSVRMETEGRGEASQAFADFMRERYMPAYRYSVERSSMPAVAAQAPRTPSPLAAIEESTDEEND